LETFTEGQLSLLKDIADAGSSHAATALSQLLNRDVHIKNIRIEWIAATSLFDIARDPDAGVAALSFRIFGDARGNILILFPKRDAQNLIMQLTGESPPKYPFVEPLDVSAIKEAGNILAGAYLNKVSSIINIVLLPSVPALFQDSFRNTSNLILEDWNLKQENVLITETEFLADSRITCYFCLIPDKNFLERIS